MYIICSILAANFKDQFCSIFSNRQYLSPMCLSYEFRASVFWRPNFSHRKFYNALFGNYFTQTVSKNVIIVRYNYKNRRLL